MAKLPVDRDTAIKALIQGDVETNSGENDWYLKGILWGGHKGYNEMTDEELKEALAASFQIDGDELDVDELERLAERCGDF